MGVVWVPVSRMSPGGHLCFLYGSEDERCVILRSFVSDGVSADHKILYLTDTDPDDVLRSLEPYGARALEQGRLEFRSARLDATAALLRHEQCRAAKNGYAGLRVTGESTDAGCPFGGGLDGLAALMLCQYDRRRFVPTQLDEVVRNHGDGRVRANDYYDDGLLRMSPTFSPAGLALAGELDVTVGGPFRSTLEQLARCVKGDVRVDLSELEFCDVGALRTVVRFSELLATDKRRLVLRNPPGYLLDLLRMCGWARLLRDAEVDR